MVEIYVTNAYSYITYIIVASIYTVVQVIVTIKCRGTNNSNLLLTDVCILQIYHATHV